jgi:hypothetical protein
MDDSQIAALITTAQNEETMKLGFNLFKLCGYKKNRIKRLIVKEIKRRYREGIKVERSYFTDEYYNIFYANKGCFSIIDFREYDLPF